MNRDAPFLMVISNSIFDPHRLAGEAVEPRWTRFRKVYDIIFGDLVSFDFSIPLDSLRNGKPRRKPKITGVPT